MLEVRRFLSRLISFTRNGKAESELEREINAHLQLLEDQFVAKGMTPKEARYEAKRAFGGVEQTKERQRETRTFAWLAGWSMDLKLGVRMLRKSPGLTVIAVIALAVGIGFGATYLEFVNDLFRPKLSFPGADRLVGILNWDLAKGTVEHRALYEFAAWKEQLTTVEELGAARSIGENLLTADGRVQPVRGWEISASAFRVVPVPPLYGRPLLADDEKPGATPVMVIGEDLWKTRFNADPLIVGRTVRFGETIRTIVGVMPHSFGFPIYGTLWTPLGPDAATARRSEGPSIRIFGRLAAGANMAHAQSELEAISARMDEGRATTEAGRRPRIYQGIESFWAEFSSYIMLLYSFNIFFIALLGICAANVATLVFARIVTRENEISLRTALGANRGRIVAQFVAEALVLASIAAIIGLAGASAGLQKLHEVWNANNSSPLPFWTNDQLGTETIAYGVILVILGSLLIGAVPALKATGRRMNVRLKETGAHGSTMRLGKLWTGVIVTQVAVTVIFLMAVVCSGFAAYSSNWLTAEFAFPRNEYLAAVVRLEEGAAAERKKAVFSALQRRLNQDPAVINATVSANLPGDPGEFHPEFPSTGGKRGEAVVTGSARIGANYFETFRQPLVAGRLFTASEIEEGHNVAIVDETFVRFALGGKGALGQLVRESRRSGPWLEIVGVVKDIAVSPNKKTSDAMVYRPGPLGESWVVVHSRSNDAAARFRAAASATDPELRLINVRTIEQHAEADAQQVRLVTTALGIITSVVLMLATAGIYSLVSFTLARRTREIGIRNALGAAPLRIVSGILSRAVMQISVGIVLGSIPGAALGFALIDMTLDTGNAFGIVVSATAGVAVFIIAVAGISCVPAIRRALKVQLAEALRTT